MYLSNTFTNKYQKVLNSSQVSWQHNTCFFWPKKRKRVSQKTVSLNPHEPNAALGRSWFRIAIAAFKKWWCLPQKTKRWNLNTVDGRNPAPGDMVNIPLFTEFYTFQVVQDFFHQQYHAFWKGNHIFQLLTIFWVNVLCPVKWQEEASDGQRCPCS